MKKRIISLLVVIPLLLESSIFCLAAPEDADTVTTGTMTNAIDNETDVDEDIREDIEALIPEEYEEISIGTVEELIDFADKCRLDTWSVNKKVVLTDDISLLGKDFSGIPTFGGIFDGQGHTVSEFNVTDGISHLGFFSKVQRSGVVKNLNVTGSVIPSGSRIIIGGIAGDNDSSLISFSKSIIRLSKFFK